MGWLLLSVVAALFVGWTARGVHELLRRQRQLRAYRRALDAQLAKLTGFSPGTDGRCNCATCTEQRAKDARTVS